MAKNTITTTNKPSADAATAEDATLAGTLIPSTRKAPGNKKLTTKYVDVFSTPILQTKLRGLESHLTAFKGCDVTAGLRLATEGAILAAALDRFDNSVGRVRQRLGEINKRLATFQSSLNSAAKNATPGSAVAKGLAGLAGLRKSEIAASKAKRTKNAKQNAKAPAPKA